MSVTISEIKGEHCGHEDIDIEDIWVDLSHWEEGRCITLKQSIPGSSGLECIDLTPRMIDDLIEALTKHQERG